MEALVLKIKGKPEVPLEAENISPPALLGKSAREVASVPLYYGNEEVALGDFFTISGSRCTGHLHLEGDLSRVKYLGQGMDQGLLTITGSVGMHLGAGMSGGEIRVVGEAGDWLGAGMRGGLIKVKGRAGHLIGAGYRGEKLGMAGGTIIVEGSAGNETGSRMRRGLVVITGDCGDFPGVEMRAGTLIVFGQCGARPGANMRRGTIVLSRVGELLPTFTYCCTYNPNFLAILWRSLESQGVPVPTPLRQGLYERYLGDTNELGKGEILVCRNSQPA